MFKLILIYLTLSLALAAPAQDASSRFWFAQREAHALLIFGTHHDLPMSAIRPEIVQLIRGAPELLSEHNAEDVRRFRRAAASGRTHLKSRLGPKRWNALLDHLSHRANLPYRVSLGFALGRAPLAAVSQRVKLARIYKSHVLNEFILPSSDQPGLEKELTNAFERAGKPSHSLDPSNLNLVSEMKRQALEELSHWIELDDAEFAATLSNHAEGTQEFFELYLGSDVSALNGPKDDDAEADLFLRNELWMPSLLNSRSGTAVMIGAAHVYGQDGILARLRDENYTLTPLVSARGRALCAQMLYID